MDLLLDTHVLVWFAAGDRRLGSDFLNLLPNPRTRLFVSAVTAHEYVDLLMRGRFGEGVDLDQLRDVMGFHLLDFPAECRAAAQTLPDIQPQARRFKMCVRPGFRFFPPDHGAYGSRSFACSENRDDTSWADDKPVLDAAAWVVSTSHCCHRPDFAMERALPKAPRHVRL